MEDFNKTEAGKVWNVFKRNGSIEYGSWLIEELKNLDNSRSPKEYEPEQ